MNLKNFLLGALLVTAIPAPAAVISPTNLNGNSYVDYSVDGLLALDINASNLSPLLFNLSFSASEIALGSVAFNAVINNFIGFGIPDLLLDFGGLSVQPGTVQSDWLDGAAGVWGVSQNGGKFLASNGSAANEYYGLLVGDPFATGGGLKDWSINTSGLSTASSYGLRVQAVPEPGQLALLMGGLGILALMRQRRRA